MTLSKLINKAVEEFDKNCNFDEAETGCNWGTDEVKSFLTKCIQEAYMAGREEKDKLDYKKMVKDILHLVDTDFAADMDMRCLPNSKPYTQEEADKMAGIIGQVYSISHCLFCTACQSKYKLYLTNKSKEDKTND